jgi:SAM-dependent methyltransferase
VSDHFSDAAGYERATGRFTRQVARQFVPWLGVRRDARWLDCGCGTGALTAAVIDLAWAGEVAALDASADFLEYARRTLPGVRFELGSVLELPFPDARFDAVVSGCLLHHLADPRVAVGEMARVTAPGGTVGAYEWDGVFQLNRPYWEAAAGAGLAQPPIPTGFESAEALAAVLADAGLTATQTARLEAEVEFDSAEAWLETLLGRHGNVGEHWATLDEPARARLRERARERLGEGAFTIRAGAWAARGSRRQ